MAIPALFRWLSRKYPKIVQQVIEQAEKVQADDNESVTVPIDMSQPNPNGFEIDNLYLDMNAIVHPCTHPEGKPAPESEEAMMIEVFKYTERVVNAIRPRKLLMIAIDGVAPRAKMNQQRARRFRAAQDSQQKKKDRAEAIIDLESKGVQVSEEFKNEKHWDHNAITPGTPFMTLLAKSLRFWIAHKLNYDKGWANLKIILSDASVPGEGEHKIMEYIRRTRTQPGYNPNTEHVIYGLDADLIMLTLATHEPHFRVLREDVFNQSEKAAKSGCFKCGQVGHNAANCHNPTVVKSDEPKPETPFVFLDVSILREYLEIELQVPNQPFPWDLERAIDDWVVMCFFVGNDFLPHLPSLDIKENAIDMLLSIWRQTIPQMNDYLTKHGELNLTNLQFILTGLAEREDGIFKRRQEAEQRQDAARKRRKIQEDREEELRQQLLSARPSHTDMVEVTTVITDHSTNPTGLPPRPAWIPLANSNLQLPLKGKVNPLAVPPSFDGMSNKEMAENRMAIRRANLDAAKALREGLITSKSTENIMPQPPEVLQNDVVVKLLEESVTSGQKRTAVEAELPLDVRGEDCDTEAQVEDGEPEPRDETFVPPPLKILGGQLVEQEDTVRLWEPGYKERYYRQKFGVELSDIEFRRTIVGKYVEGMKWVLMYYYQGCPSWHWYYPYHFSPFASDFTDIDQYHVAFDLGEPAQPFEQLMSVFPAASAIHIPEVFHDLMKEPTSEIIDFYPEDFPVDMNGKKMLWQGVALLPFIDRPRLLSAITPRNKHLTPEEVERNTLGPVLLYMSDDNPSYDQLCELYSKKRKDDPIYLSPENGVSGYATRDDQCVPGTTFVSPLADNGMPDIDFDRSLSVKFTFPNQNYKHQSHLLPGVRLNQRVLTQYDREKIRNRQMDGGGGRDNHHGGGYGGRNNGPGFGGRTDGPGFGGRNDGYRRPQYDQSSQGRYDNGHRDNRWGNDGHDPYANPRSSAYLDQYPYSSQPYSQPSHNGQYSTSSRRPTPSDRYGNDNGGSRDPYQGYDYRGPSYSGRDDNGWGHPDDRGHSNREYDQGYGQYNRSYEGQGRGRSSLDNNYRGGRRGRY